jgi:hypothetical protein
MKNLTKRRRLLGQEQLRSMITSQGSNDEKGQVASQRKPEVVQLQASSPVSRKCPPAMPSMKWTTVVKKLRKQMKTRARELAEMSSDDSDGDNGEVDL